MALLVDFLYKETTALKAEHIYHKAGNPVKSVETNYENKILRV
jgi:hypothetical protein